MESNTIISNMAEMDLQTAPPEVVSTVGPQQNEATNDQQLPGSFPLPISPERPGSSASDESHKPGVETPSSSVEGSKGEESKNGGETCDEIQIVVGPWTEDSEQVCSRGALILSFVDDFQTITRPFDYVMSLPGKNFRTQILSAFNVWLQVDEKSYNIIDKVIGMLHNASLLYVESIHKHSAGQVLRLTVSTTSKMVHNSAAALRQPIVCLAMLRRLILQTMHTFLHSKSFSI